MSNEKIPPEKKKLITYLLLSLGVVTIILFVMTIWGIVNKKQVPPPKVSPPSTNATSTNNIYSPEQFEEKVKTTKNTHVQEVDVNEHKQTNIEIALAKERIKFQVAELNRGLNASKSTWLSQSQFTNQTQASSPAKIKNSTIDDLEKQRDETAKRIEEVRQVRSAIEQNGGSNISTEKLEQIRRKFSLPPPNIVGFTRSNRYNADVSGKIRLSIGTVIPVLTTTTTVSDYSGLFKGVVSQDIYDVKYQYVLIPKGSEVIMKSVKITNVNEPIQARVGITVPWIILPNGNKIDMSKSSGLDREGIGAIKDEVNYHAMAQFMGVAAYALLSSSSSYEGSGANNDNSYKGEMGDAFRQQTAPIAKKYLSLTPTITIKAGQSMNIITEDEMYLKAWKSVYQDYQ
ncbi:TrbI/VirB10 family protein [Vibrio algicola]|uniref:TrbI/VirB10 family protein n=1 Tax=Vibrio algicola TaxID=2662262 RepID=UPI0015B4683D|nr:TrbI/VirB10 family protein [Vibrio algicola]